MLKFIYGNFFNYRAVVVAQLVERLLLTSDVRSLNPVIWNFIYYPTVLKLRWKDKNKVAGMGHWFKNILNHCNP